ncbi:hypothetical protein MXB_2873 [Myxobolus squamalis]|nr:hypothetical protein MXB_2873 [Myxobolus squamalis]
MVKIDFEYAAYCAITSIWHNICIRGIIFTLDKQFGDVSTITDFKVFIMMTLNHLKKL